MSHFTDEEQLVLSCLKWMIKGEPVAISPGIDWPLALDLASSHKLEPLLFAAILSSQMPDNVANILAGKARTRKARTAVMLKDFETVHENLISAGIQVMPLKGILLAQTVYPSNTFRFFDDIDLLVRARDSEAAIQVLQKLDYVPHPRSKKYDWHHMPPYIHSKHNTMFEIHFDVVRRSQQGWEIDGIWNRATRSTLGSVYTWLMDVEDALILTALHARHNLYGKLSSVTDAGLLCGQLAAGENGESKLRHLAKEAGAQCALAYLIESANRLFELHRLPHFPCDRSRLWLAQKTTGWKSLSPSRRSLAKGTISNVLEVSLMDSSADSLRLVTRLAIPPRSFIKHDAGLDEKPAISYGKRFWKRISIATNQGMDLVRRRKTKKTD